MVATAGLDPAVVSPTTAAAFVRPAPHPSYSVLSHESLVSAGITPIGGWAQRWGAAGELVLEL